MQIKKYEGSTLQEALEKVKRELGPEAIILQTRKMKKGFGALAKNWVEITAAVSDRSLNKKAFTEKRMPEPTVKKLEKMPAAQQADIYDDYLESHLEKTLAQSKDRVEIGVKTTRRYAEIEDDTETKVETKGSSFFGIRKPKEPTKERVHHRQDVMPATQTEDIETPVIRGGGLEGELKRLKSSIEEMKRKQESELTQALKGGAAIAGPSLSTPALHEAFEQLLLHGIERRYALQLIRKASFDLSPDELRSGEAISDGLAQAILEGVAVIPGVVEMSRSSGGPRVVTLLGPTGVGKTTSLAKMTALAQSKAGLKVGLINFDYFKVAAFEQLATYAKVLGVPFRSVRTLEELLSALKEMKGLDLILIDTAGRSQRDQEALQELSQILSQVETQLGVQRGGQLSSMTHYLVVSASTREMELQETVQRFSIFHPQGLIVSKLDEAMTYGVLYNLAQRSKLPYVYFTTGQRVPEDIESATCERIAALILDL